MPERLLAEAKRGVVGVPVVAKPVPAQEDPVVALAETRDAEVAMAVPHDGLPAEDYITGKQFTEHGDALGLDRQEVGEAETTFKQVVGFQVTVDHLPGYPACLLPFVEPLLHIRRQVVLGGAPAFEPVVGYGLSPGWVF